MFHLAIRGGKPIRRKTFPFYATVGKEEKKALGRVIDSGVLSKFLGSWHKDFYGGPEIRKLETQWARFFKIKHAIAVNSATSGLYCAVGAVGIEPGDEVIVSPYTMSASATSPIIWGGVPVFADIEEDFFCLDPRSVEERLTSRTKAIIIVDLFGQPYDVQRITAIARKKGIPVIEDAAQATAATYRDRYAGTLGDLGVFSLNCHKHIQSGEGGVVVTNDDRLAERVRLIRNHAEAVVREKGEKDIVNMVGFNFRMTELEAAVNQCQLKKLSRFVRTRVANCEYLSRQLRNIPALILPKVRPYASHVYYMQPFRWNSEAAGFDRHTFVEAVRAELAPTQKNEDFGVRIWEGYCKPLYLLPMYQKKIAIGTKGYPFLGPQYTGSVDYSKGICPVAEQMYEKELFTSDLMTPGFTTRDLDDVVMAFQKVWKYREELG